MAHAGQIVLFQFPQTDLLPGKWRPALIVQPLPGPFDDWVLCMITTQLDHEVEGFDEIVAVDDVTFAGTGL